LPSPQIVAALRECDVEIKPWLAQEHRGREIVMPVLSRTRRSAA
jgi:hypothetical protein